MALKMLFNGGMAVFFIYCYIYTIINPPPPTTLPHDMSGAHWARGILILLIFFIILNIVNIYRTTPAEDRNMSSVTSLNFAGIFKSKLLLGMLILFAYAYMLPYAGFLLASFIMVMLYIVLLGERRFVRVPIYSFVIVAVFYALFFGGLDIWLPRGVGPIRDFSIMVERLFW